MKQEIKFSKHCPQCDSENIFREAFATWNVAAQSWEYDGDDLSRCNDCFWSGYSITTKETDRDQKEENHE